MAKLKKRKDGRYCKQITINGKRHCFYGFSEREITKKILEFEEKEQNSVKFKCIAEDWWDEHESTLAEQSKRVYKRSMDELIDEFGDIYITDIKPKDITVFYKCIAAQGLSQKTIEKRRMVLSLIFDYAINNDMLQYNIVTSVKIPKGLPKAKRDPASPEDERKIKESFDVWALPYIALYTGMRKGEILALKWEDIDFTEDLIDVTKSVAHKGDKPFVKDTKTKKGTRKVILLAPLKEKLLKFKKGKKSADYVISDDGKKPLTNRRYITLMDNFHEKTGTCCTAHQLRHSFSTIALECGLEPKIIQELLGHEQISTTLDIYTSVRKESLNQAKELLNKKFS